MLIKRAGLIKKLSIFPSFSLQTLFHVSVSRSFFMNFYKWGWKLTEKNPLRGGNRNFRKTIQINSLNRCNHRIKLAEMNFIATKHTIFDNQNDCFNCYFYDILGTRFVFLIKLVNLLWRLFYGLK